MFICNDCGETFDDFKEEYDYHPYGMGYAEERYGVCPYCNSTDFSEARECEQCGKIVAEEDCCVGDEFEDLCKNCYEEKYG